MNADETKRCAKCWRYLPLTDFAHDGRTRDRLTYRCNDCRADGSSGTFVANPHFHGDL
jgi:hypothetical protein